MNDVATDCLFCRLARGEIPATMIARTERSLAFADVAPQAPTHALVVPLRHAATLEAFVAAASPDEVADLFGLAARIGREAAPGGHRFVINDGRDGGQHVAHLHVHVLGGRAMGWPPG